MSDKEIMKKAIATYGKLNQMIMLFEEMSELQKEVSKFIRGEDNKDYIEEEFADVMIMLEQLMMICELDAMHIELWRTFKLYRLEERLQRE